MTDRDRIDFFVHETELLQRQLIYAKGRYAPKSTASQLAKYARYRNSAKGRARTERYNTGQARLEASARYRATIGYMQNTARREIARCTALLDRLYEEHPGGWWWRERREKRREQRRKISTVETSTPTLSLALEET